MLGIRPIAFVAQIKIKAQRVELAKAVMLQGFWFIYDSVVPNLGSPDIVGLKFPEAFTTSCAGQDFWEV